MGSPGDEAGAMAGWERAQRPQGSSSTSPPAPSPGGMHKGLGLEAVGVTWSVEEAQEEPSQSNTCTWPRVLREDAGGQGASNGQEAAGVQGRATPPPPPPPSRLAPGTSTLEPEVEGEDEAAVPEEVRREQQRLRELRRESEASAVSATSSRVHRFRALVSTLSPA